MKKSDKNRTLSGRAVCGEEGVAVREFLTKVGDKWTILIVVSLSQVPGCRARFSELEKMIPAISQRMLALTLRNLERDGLVTRELFPEVPPRVEYELTTLGRVTPDARHSGLGCTELAARKRGANRIRRGMRHGTAPIWRPVRPRPANGGLMNPGHSSESFNTSKTRR